MKKLSHFGKKFDSVGMLSQNETICEGVSVVVIPLGPPAPPFFFTLVCKSMDWRQVALDTHVRAAELEENFSEFRASHAALSEQMSSRLRVLEESFSDDSLRSERRLASWRLVAAVCIVLGGSILSGMVAAWLTQFLLGIY